MSLKFDTKQKILLSFKERGVLWVTKLSEILWITRPTLYKYLKYFIEKWEIEKFWKSSHVKYFLSSLIKNKVNIRKKDFLQKINKEKTSPSMDWMTFILNKDKTIQAIMDWWKIIDQSKVNRDNFFKNTSFKTQRIILEYFWKLSSDWNILEWFNGFLKWCFERKLNPVKKSEDFIKIFNLIENSQNNCWLLDAKDWFWKHFENVYLDEIYYTDQYIWWEFWRWKLAEKTFHSKTSQNKQLIADSIREIIWKLSCTILKWDYDAIAITPWSIDRKNQLLNFLQKEVEQFWLPFVNIIKYYPNDIPVAQKSLKKTNERIQNARNTIFIDDENTRNYKKVFLIDDFVWSWSTLNETACKLKEEWVEFVTWFAFVWNLDLKYEVINEV